MVALDQRFYFPTRPGARPMSAAEERRDVWETLLRFVTERGGAISTHRFAWPAKLECARDAPLLAELALATLFVNGRPYSFVLRPLTEADTAGPVRRMASDGGVSTVAVTEISFAR